MFVDEVSFIHAYPQSKQSGGGVCLFWCLRVDNVQFVFRQASRPIEGIYCCCMQGGIAVDVVGVLEQPGATVNVASASP